MAALSWALAVVGLVAGAWTGRLGLTLAGVAAGLATLGPPELALAAGLLAILAPRVPGAGPRVLLLLPLAGLGFFLPWPELATRGLPRGEVSAILLSRHFLAWIGLGLVALRAAR